MYFFRVERDRKLELNYHQIIPFVLDSPLWFQVWQIEAIYLLFRKASKLKKKRKSYGCLLFYLVFQQLRTFLHSKVGFTWGLTILTRFSVTIPKSSWKSTKAFSSCLLFHKEGTTIKAGAFYFRYHLLPLCSY